MRKMIIGAADIGGTTTKLGLFDEDLRLIKSWSIPTDVSDNGRNILPNLCESLKTEAALICGEYCSRNSKTESSSKQEPDVKDSLQIKEEGASLGGVGIAVPAAVDEHGIARNCTNIGWGTVDLRAEVSKLLPEVRTLCFGNDATVAALGELRKGAGRRYASTYLLTLGTGVGGGYASVGKVVSGAHGAAGEIGHLTINPHESSPCMCGRYGCLEQYASAAGIVRLADNLIYLRQESNGCDNINIADTGDNKYSEASTENISSDCIDYETDKETIGKKRIACVCDKLNGRVHIERLFDLEIPAEQSCLEAMQHFDAKDICDAAKSGDKLSLYILDVFGSCMGLAMSSISCTIDPECFIIGGGMSKAGDIVLNAIRKGYAKYAYPACKDTEIIQAELGNAAGIYGCAAMVSEALTQ